MSTMIAQMVDELHGKIMNLPCNVPEGYAPGMADEAVYRIGHRDARHAAAELVCAALAQPAREPVNAQMLAALREGLSVCNSVRRDKHRRVMVNDHTMYAQTDEWCKWVEEEVAPKLTAAIAAATAQAQPDPWRDAVDAELVTIQATSDSYPTPRDAVRALINWHCAVQIDPAVSSAAQALIEQGRREAQAQPAAVPVAWIRHDYSGTGQRHLSFEGPPNPRPVRDEVVNPLWTPLYAPVPAVPAPAVPQDE